MKILVTGKYEPDYNRNHVLLRGLEKKDVSLTEFPYEKRTRAVRKKITSLAENHDIIFLPSFTHLDVPFVRRATKKPIVFDPLISRYLSKVFDYKAVWRYSPRALKNYLKDLRAFNRSDLILADTEGHKNYYINKFHVNPVKIAVVHVGVHCGDFFPSGKIKNPCDKFLVGFYGSFIPLHGIEKIIEAARILRERNDIEFQIYGNGPGYEKIQKLIEIYNLVNVSLKGWADYKDLNAVINGMDVCLGIFGDSLKAKLVIPNKIYHYAACKKAIITADTEGIKEIFKNRKNIILVQNNPQSLADSVVELAGNDSLMQAIAKSAFATVNGEYNETRIAEEFLTALESLPGFS